jgi:hypothetical protein
LEHHFGILIVMPRFFLAFLNIGFKIPYRMVQGIVRGLSEYEMIVEEIHFAHIRIRMVRIKPAL